MPEARLRLAGRALGRGAVAPRVLAAADPPALVAAVPPVRADRAVETQAAGAIPGAEVREAGTLAAGTPGVVTPVDRAAVKETVDLDLDGGHAAGRMRILIAEDDPILGGQVRRALAMEGHAVDLAVDGVDAAHMGAHEPYDLVILDLGLPALDGLSILRQWRSEGHEMPVLILTARDGWTAKVDGLDAGADDYITKPFHMPELSARVRALLRRRTGKSPALFEFDDLVIDLATMRCLKDGMTVDLTAQEAAVLSYLLHNMGRMVTRTELSDHIYSYDGDRDSNTIAVFVARLRKKLGHDLIRTLRGRGYVIDKPGT
jgi:two-component system, OmpR family, response regulator